MTTWRELHGLFHAAWSSSVGKPGYQKAAWLALDERLFWIAPQGFMARESGNERARPSVADIVELVRLHRITHPTGS